MDKETQEKLSKLHDRIDKVMGLLPYYLLGQGLLVVSLVLAIVAGGWLVHSSHPHHGAAAVKDVMEIRERLNSLQNQLIEKGTEND